MSSLATVEKHIHLPGGGLHVVGSAPRPRKTRVHRAGSGRKASETKKLADLYQRLQFEGLTPGQLAVGGETITAAATRIEKATSQDLRRLIQPWQARALTYYDMIGEVWFSSQFYSRTLAKVRLFPAVLDDNGDPQESDDPVLEKLWARVQDPSGGRSELQASYGRLMFLIGEGYLIVEPDPDWGEVWEFLSPDELRVQPGGIIVRYRAPQIGTEEYYTAPEGEFTPIEGIGTAPDQVVPWRLWRKHPRFSWWADGPVHATLDILEELLLLTLAVRSQAKSRAANSGILLWPDEMSLPQLDASGDEDPLNDPFFEEFAANYIAPINDPGSSSAGTPLFVRMAAAMIAESAGGPRFMKFDANDAYGEQGMRSELIRRYAMGIDLPPEQLLGMQDSSHWTAWLIDENSWKAHLMPITQQMCNDFGSAYLRPAAREAGYANWAKVVVGYDATEVINHPDRGKDAKDLFDDGALSEEAYREAKGFDDADAPSMEERARYIGIKVRDSSLAWDGVPSVKAGGIEPEPGVIESTTGTSDEPTGATSGNEVDKSAPESETVADDNREPITSSAFVASDRVVGAAEMALERCREIAGSRIMTRVKNQRCEDCLTTVDGQESTLYAAALGLEQLANLKLDPSKLVDGGAKGFARKAAGLGLRNGYGPELAEIIERHAAATLHEEDPGLPEEFHALLAVASSV